jgi:hypothetical protein
MKLVMTFGIGLENALLSCCPISWVSWERTSMAFQLLSCCRSVLLLHLCIFGGLFDVFPLCWEGSVTLNGGFDVDVEAVVGVDVDVVVDPGSASFKKGVPRQSVEFVVDVADAV